MDYKFTEQIRHWLETHEDERDYAVGISLSSELSGNQIMYRNLIANPSAKADFIVYQIQKYYNFRVQALTPCAGRRNGRTGADHCRRASSDR